MREMQWYVFVENFNGKKVEKYNIFEHERFAEDVKKIYKKYKNDFDSFSIEVRKSLMYYFWSKCEWEIILSGWPSRDDFCEKKIDVFEQVNMNYEVFIKYVWDMAHARKAPARKEEKE